jgi:sterol desaturase/sphingolipid hydroxylase (fatty acid hydroxylase superfamily)
LIVLKLVLISLLVDAWLYWVHRFSHSSYSPGWLRRAHGVHHAQFSLRRKFELHPIEFVVEAIPLMLIGCIMHPLFGFAIIAWGLFEAARGHGHFTWFKLIPRWYYKAFGFCGGRYHAVHHAPHGEHVNMGQMLRLWDVLCNTRARSL